MRGKENSLTGFFICDLMHEFGLDWLCAWPKLGLQFTSPPMDGCFTAEWGEIASQFYEKGQRYVSNIMLLSGALSAYKMCWTIIFPWLYRDFHEVVEWKVMNVPARRKSASPQWYKKTFAFRGHWTYSHYSPSYRSLLLLYSYTCHLKSDGPSYNLFVGNRF
jgi:hypothetical protein